MSGGEGDDTIKKIAGNGKYNYRWKQPDPRVDSMFFSGLFISLIRSSEKHHTTVDDCCDDPVDIVFRFKCEKEYGEGGCAGNRADGIASCRSGGSGNLPADDSGDNQQDRVHKVRTERG